MRVFVTGASGFVGQAVVRELLDNGHQVLGLARSDASATALTEAGADVHRGDLTDIDSLLAGTAAADGVIHLAFIHDFSKFQSNIETDNAAVKAMIASLAGSDKPFIGTSGTLMLAPGRLATERDAAGSHGGGVTRGDTEKVVTGAEGVRGGVVRLSPSVHDAGDHGFIPMLIGMAREKGYAAYVGDGANRWSAVHRADAGRLYRLAIEQAQAGATWHGVGEEGVAMRDIAAVIGEGLGVPVRSIAQEEAPGYFGWMAGFAGSDNPTSNAITRETLGWEPRGIGLLDDIRANYF
ncbi:SDR family oxidoreductase [Sphingomonas panacisoli]|uniref:SDR family oxidoreductase n=1 Tax=Sphingomonas panacisoli TaxID=1813879 RepID=A0A5B8LL78_9SPHN|nr:SDR family oxidoreductase [Sphingomonas panacisoli]QDZ08324.1 SDR family oxidoreductase [Sphingomonas panacisoli]